MVRVEGMDEIVEMLGLKHAIDILLVLDEPMDALEISEEIDCPRASVYIRLRDMEDMGLVEIADKKMPKGRPFDGGSTANMYIRTFHRAVLDMEHDTHSLYGSPKGYYKKKYGDM